MEVKDQGLNVTKGIQMISGGEITGPGIRDPRSGREAPLKVGVAFIPGSLTPALSIFQSDNKGQMRPCKWERALITGSGSSFQLPIKRRI